MVCIQVCGQCQSGNHDCCLGNSVVPKGVFGGHICSCCGSLSQSKRVEKTKISDCDKKFWFKTDESIRENPIRKQLKDLYDRVYNVGVHEQRGDAEELLSNKGLYASFEDFENEILLLMETQNETK